MIEFERRADGCWLTPEYVSSPLIVLPRDGLYPTIAGATIADVTRAARQFDRQVRESGHFDR